MQDCHVSLIPFNDDELLKTEELNIGPIFLEVSYSGVITFFNTAATNFLKKVGLNGNLTLFLPKDINEIIKELKQKMEAPLYREVEIEGFTLAENIHLISESNVIRIYANDISEHKKPQSELINVQNIESLGVHVGMLAHDFNNILTVIQGNISLINISAKLEHNVCKSLSNMEKAVIQAKGLIHQILTLSKGECHIKETASISELIKDSADLVLRGSNVKCKFFMPNDLWPVDVNIGQINQVLNNLVINATHAMPKGGIIQISAKNIAKCDETCPASFEKEKYVQISVKDHGTGIRKEHLDKIFEPYFTTKQNGSGLGLASSYSIIKKHEGLIKVESELGLGTQFHIYLPASSKEIVEEREIC
ncbi:MAG: two-component system sensor histidine kinase NtrB [Candidatus Anammoxibacter sp.]